MGEMGRIGTMGRWDDGTMGRWDDGTNGTNGKFPIERSVTHQALAPSSIPAPAHLNQQDKFLVRSTKIWHQVEIALEGGVLCVHLLSGQ